MVVVVVVVGDYSIIELCIHMAISIREASSRENDTPLGSRWWLLAMFLVLRNAVSCAWGSVGLLALTSGWETVNFGIILSLVAGA